MKIHRVGDKLFHLNPQTDTTKLVVAFRHVGNSPDKWKRILGLHFPYFQLFKKLPKLCKLKIQYHAHNLPTTSPHIEPDDSNPYPPTNRASSAMFYWNNALPGNGWTQLVQRWMSAYPCVNRAR